MKQIGMVRAFWNEREYHKQLWKEKDITVLFCQYKTYDITRLCLESLLNHYPEIPILIVDHSPSDRSGQYLKQKAKKYDNIQIWERQGLNSHGIAMDEAIRQRITTRYVLSLDSDVISIRPGWVELMLSQMQSSGCFAIGSLMIVSYRNDGCGSPFDESDILRYAHPSCSIYDRDVYLTLKPFCNHGAPCYATMKQAQDKGLHVEYFPIDMYVAHLSGASWCDPRTIWNSDLDTMIRPFVTFIITDPVQFHSLKNQTDHDFDAITIGNRQQHHVIIHDGEAGINVDNSMYDIRFKITGEYVCYLPENIASFDRNLVAELKKMKIDPWLEHNGLFIFERKYWQYREALHSRV